MIQSKFIIIAFSSALRYCKHILKHTDLHPASLVVEMHPVSYKINITC